RTRQSEDAPSHLRVTSESPPRMLRGWSDSPPRMLRGCSEDAPRWSDSAPTMISLKSTAIFVKSVPFLYDFLILFIPNSHQIHNSFTTFSLLLLSKTQLLFNKNIVDWYS
ncbi:MAG: hypothetical protein PHX22_04070, partial [Dysgonamonadaceae bacterium]|nr:hypothetical protein [Dysgonamonadaceae bacterium]